VEISTARDIVIVILGCLYIILTIGIIVGLIIVFIQLKHLIDSIKRKFQPVYRWMCFFRNLSRNLNQYANIIK
jgi:hypothetical protein